MSLRCSHCDPRMPIYAAVLQLVHCNVRSEVLKVGDGACKVNDRFEVGTLASQPRTYHCCTFQCKSEVEFAVSRRNASRYRADISGRTFRSRELRDIRGLIIVLSQALCVASA